VPEAFQSLGLASPGWHFVGTPGRPRHCFGAAPTSPNIWCEAILMRRMIEQLFEAAEANAGYAVFSVTVSLAMTGCLRFFWE
jgi:hypothetical protein